MRNLLGKIISYFEIACIFRSSTSLYTCNDEFRKEEYELTGDFSFHNFPKVRLTMEQRYDCWKSLSIEEREKIKEILRVYMEKLI
jgi:hypothetical protein